MPVDIMLTVVATAVVQSIFGVGVLLFGMPVLLLLGHSFVDTLVILLPISLAINSLQIAKHRAHIDFSFYRQILLFTLPPIALFLFLVTHTGVNVGVLLGAFVLLVALKEFSDPVTRMIDRFMQYEKSYFVLMGAIHGLSSLGGSLLTALVHHKAYPKDTARVTVASSYATFAAVQLATLYVFSRQQIDVPYSENGIYVAVASLVFLLADEVLYLHIGQDKYRRIFSAFLAVSGGLLILKSL